MLNDFYFINAINGINLPSYIMKERDTTKEVSNIYRLYRLSNKNIQGVIFER